LNIGLDIGYGYVKAVNDEGKKIFFPSIVSIGFERLLDVFNKDLDIVKNLYVQIVSNEGSKSYFVGELAQRESPFGIFNLQSHRTEIAETQVLLATAAALLISDNEEQINIVTGLPLKQYKEQKNSFYNMVKNFRAVVSFPDYNITRIVKFNNVVIFPQAAGAVYYALMNKDTEKYLIKNTYITLVDIGFKTTDYATFYYNHKMDFVSDLSGTIDLGMSRILTALDKLYTQKTGSNTDIEGLMTILQDNKIYYKGQFIDFSNEIKMLKQEMTRAITKTILSTLGDRYEKVSTLFIAGGGGKDLYENFKDIHHNVELVHDAQFANANGFLKVCQIQKM
jgi:plasmid segregation protein ParM